MANEDKKATPPAKTAVKKVENGKKLGFFRRVAKWFREMKSELRKVIWPTAKQTRNNTAIAIGFMAVAAIAIWGFDWLADQAIKALITIAG